MRLVWPSSEDARSLASEAASEVQTKGEEEKTRRYPAARLPGSQEIEAADQAKPRFGGRMSDSNPMFRMNKE